MPELRKGFRTLVILVIDDEPDVEALFRQLFRRDLREGGFVMEFAQSGHTALRHIADGNADLGKWGNCKTLASAFTKLGLRNEPMVHTKSTEKEV
jgi:hypothetical protein